MPNGTIARLLIDKGFGFIRDEGGIELGVLSVTPLRTLRMRMIADDRARGALTIGAAVVVVVLAGFGLHGIQRYVVTAGRREYAIRASIGAGPKALGRLVIRRGLILGLPGLVLATLLAFIAVAWLRDDYVSPDISPSLVTFTMPRKRTTKAATPLFPCGEESVLISALRNASSVTFKPAPVRLKTNVPLLPTPIP